MIHQGVTPTPSTCYNTINRNQPMRTCVRYFAPYAQTWREQWFPTLGEAERMVDFYRSCGTPAHLAP